VSHPSFLDLDRLALGEASPDVRAHAARCAACAAHVERMRAAPPLPEWARAVALPRTPRGAGRFRLRWLSGLVAAGAAAAAAVVFVVPAEKALYVAPKGMPSVALYVLRDDRAALWNGTDPLRAGDRIRLKVAPEGYGWLAVSAMTPGGSRGLLHQARIDPGAEYLLPESWRLDAAPGPERLHIALDVQEVDPARAAWSTTLEIPKEPAR
jgi:hypothetical protein